jgi:hypothetical protein
MLLWQQLLRSGAAADACKAGAVEALVKLLSQASCAAPAACACARWCGASLGSRACAVDKRAGSGLGADRLLARGACEGLAGLWC